MNDTSANNAGSIEAGVTKAGEALGELVQSATAATAAAVGHAQKTVQDATAVTAVAAGQARRMLGDASEAARQARGQAGAVAEHVVDTGCRATRSVSRQIHGKPLMAVLVGFVLGYVAGLWTGRGAGRRETMPNDQANAKAPSP